jgi:3-dehydroquinate synthase
VSLEDVIARSIAIKIAVVEQDERESGLRRVLNFGHTVGHGIESLGLGYYHGECVALGMLYMCSDEVRKRLVPVLESLGLPVKADFDREAVLEAISHDKKSVSGGVNAVTVDRVGAFEIKKFTDGELRQLVFVGY